MGAQLVSEWGLASAPQRARIKKGRNLKNAKLHEFSISPFKKGKQRGRGIEEEVFNL